MREKLLTVLILGLLLLAACTGAPETAESEPAEAAPAATDAEPAADDHGGALDLRMACQDDEGNTVAGPQAPRDIDQAAGENAVTFAKAPAATEMNLCDIHYHRFAEHKAAGFATPAGEGDHAGYACAGHEPAADAEMTPAATCGQTSLGDTVEVHWVFTTCDSEERLGHGLGTCLAGCEEPQLRVEARVFYLTEDEGALNFADFSDAENIQVPPADAAVEYLGSTTGAAFNPPEVCSKAQVTWNVGAACSPLSLSSLDAWCGQGNNVFDEDHAHSVRTLVEDPAFLAPIN